MLKKLALNGCNVELLSEQTTGIDQVLTPISQTQNSLMKFLYNIHYSQYNEVYATKYWLPKIAIGGACAALYVSRNYLDKKLSGLIMSYVRCLENLNEHSR